MITLQAAIDKLEAMQSQLADGHPHRVMISMLIGEVRSDPSIDTTDEFCNMVEPLNFHTLEDGLKHLWNLWYGQAPRNSRSGARSKPEPDQGGV